MTIPPADAAAQRGLDHWWHAEGAAKPHATYWPQIKALMDFMEWADGYDQSFVTEANAELRNDE